MNDFIYEGGHVEDLTGGQKWSDSDSSDGISLLAHILNPIFSKTCLQQDVLQRKWTPENSSLESASVGRNKHLDA